MKITKEMKEICAMLNKTPGRQECVSIEESYKAVSRFDREDYEVHSYSNLNDIKI